MHKSTNYRTYNIVGIMSGTSLDGVDLSHCSFTPTGKGYTYKLNTCKTVPYPAEWTSRLRQLHRSTAEEYTRTHAAYGRYLGELAREFSLDSDLPVDYIASHGHTIFHQPWNGFTGQIGDGAALAIASGYPVICDFRSSDVAAGGQGAPLVPVGDELLFGEYTCCLNLGGFANISTRSGEQRVAFDICPANFVLNHFASKRGLPYDKGGRLARTGKINQDLLDALNALSYYEQQSPKSLGREWVETEFLPLTGEKLSIEDTLRTLVEHIAFQTGKNIPALSDGNVLVTGGGAHNEFLIERIRSYTSLVVHIPDPLTVDFKEALVFAFLGLLRILEKPNCLATVTGASGNVCGGAVYLP